MVPEVGKPSIERERPQCSGTIVAGYNVQAAQLRGIPDLTTVTDVTLQLWSGEVLAEWLDYNGHMTEHRYLQVFGESTDRLLAVIGVDFEKPENGSYYTLQTHIHHLKECRVSETLKTATEILGHDAKRLHIFHRLFSGGDVLVATGEHLIIHVAHGKACDASPQYAEKISQLFLAQRGRQVPESVGAVLRRPLAHMRR